MEIRDQTETILASIADGVFTVDPEWKVTSFNHAAEKITGIKRDEAIGCYCWDVFRASICERSCSLRQTMATGKHILNKAIYIVNSHGKRVPVSISTALLKDKNEKTIGGVETFRDLSLEVELRKELEGRHSFLDIISKNPEMHRLFGILEQVSESNSTVLLNGESGTGKELFAKAIHSLSSRRQCPMITINCGALPDTLLESELFGYKAGAFTDARKDKPGRLAQAEGGTLFLDEIGDISQAMQVRMLRVLQDKIYDPLGSTKPQKANVRIITATNHDLEQLVAKGTFRQDLYYRINVVKLELPPLRNRKEDIPLLIEHFIHKFNILNNKEIQGVSPDILPVLMAYDYPGNIRQLENVIEYISVVCRGNLVCKEHLPDYLKKQIKTDPCPLTENARPEHIPFYELEKHFLLEILNKNKWNKSASAKEMGIHPSTLWRKLKKYKIHPLKTSLS